MSVLTAEVLTSYLSTLLTCIAELVIVQGKLDNEEVISQW